jgi:hypothetical protein
MLLIIENHSRPVFLSLYSPNCASTFSLSTAAAALSLDETCEEPLLDFIFRSVPFYDLTLESISTPGCHVLRTEES